MASKTGKAAQRADIKKQGGGFERLRDSARFVVLNRGQHCYVLTASGKTMHTLVGSEAFIAEATILHAAEPVLVAREMSAIEDKFPGLGWGTALDAITAPADEAVAA